MYKGRHQQEQKKIMINASRRADIDQGVDHIIQLLKCDDIGSVFDILTRSPYLANKLDTNGHTIINTMITLPTNHISYIKKLLQMNGDVNITDIVNRTALMTACGVNKIDIVTLLLESGAKCDMVDIHNDPAIMYSTRRSPTPFTIEFINNLRSHRVTSVIDNVKLDNCSSMLKKVMLIIWYNIKSQYNDTIKKNMIDSLKSIDIENVDMSFKKSHINTLMANVTRIMNYHDEHIVPHDAIIRSSNTAQILKSHIRIGKDTLINMCKDNINKKINANNMTIKNICHQLRDIIDSLTHTNESVNGIIANSLYGNQYIVTNYANVNCTDRHKITSTNAMAKAFEYTKDSDHLSHDVICGLNKDCADYEKTMTVTMLDMLTPTCVYTYNTGTIKTEVIATLLDRRAIPHNNKTYTTQKNMQLDFMDSPEYGNEICKINLYDINDVVTENIYHDAFCTLHDIKQQPTVDNKYINISTADPKLLGYIKLMYGDGSIGEFDKYITKGRHFQKRIPQTIVAYIDNDDSTKVTPFNNANVVNIPYYYVGKGYSELNAVNTRWLYTEQCNTAYIQQDDHHKQIYINNYTQRDDRRSRSFCQSNTFINDLKKYKDTPLLLKASIDESEPDKPKLPHYITDTSDELYIADTQELLKDRLVFNNIASSDKIYRYPYDTPTPNMSLHNVSAAPYNNPDNSNQSVKDIDMIASISHKYGIPLDKVFDITYRKSDENAKIVNDRLIDEFDHYDPNNVLMFNDTATTAANNICRIGHNCAIDQQIHRRYYTTCDYAIEQKNIDRVPFTYDGYNFYYNIVNGNISTETNQLYKTISLTDILHDNEVKYTHAKGFELHNDVYDETIRNFEIFRTSQLELTDIINNYITSYLESTDDVLTTLRTELRNMVMCLPKVNDLLQHEGMPYVNDMDSALLINELHDYVTKFISNNDQHVGGGADVRNIISKLNKCIYGHQFALYIVADKMYVGHDIPYVDNEIDNNIKYNLYADDSLVFVSEPNLFKQDIKITIYDNDYYIKLSNAISQIVAISNAVYTNNKFDKERYNSVMHEHVHQQSFFREFMQLRINASNWKNMNMKKYKIQQLKIPLEGVLTKIKEYLKQFDDQSLTIDHILETIQPLYDNLLFKNKMSNIIQPIVSKYVGLLIDLIHTDYVDNKLIYSKKQIIKIVMDSIIGEMTQCNNIRMYCEHMSKNILKCINNPRNYGDNPNDDICQIINTFAKEHRLDIKDDTDTVCTFKDTIECYNLICNTIIYTLELNKLKTTTINEYQNAYILSYILFLNKNDESEYARQIIGMHATYSNNLDFIYELLVTTQLIKSTIKVAQKYVNQYATLKNIIDINVSVFNKFMSIYTDTFDINLIREQFNKLKFIYGYVSKSTNKYKVIICFNGIIIKATKRRTIGIFADVDRKDTYEDNACTVYDSFGHTIGSCNLNDMFTYNGTHVYTINYYRVYPVLPNYTLLKQSHTHTPKIEKIDNKLQYWSIGDKISQIHYFIESNNHTDNHTELSVKSSFDDESLDDESLDDSVDNSLTRTTHMKRDIASFQSNFPIGRIPDHPHAYTYPSAEYSSPTHKHRSITDRRFLLDGVDERTISIGGCNERSISAGGGYERSISFNVFDIYGIRIGNATVRIMFDGDHRKVLSQQFYPNKNHGMSYVCNCITGNIYRPINTIYDIDDDVDEPYKHSEQRSEYIINIMNKYANDASICVYVSANSIHAIELDSIMLSIYYFSYIITIAYIDKKIYSNCRGIAICNARIILKSTVIELSDIWKVATIDENMPHLLYACEDVSYRHKQYYKVGVLNITSTLINIQTPYINNFISRPVYNALFTNGSTIQSVNDTQSVNNNFKKFVIDNNKIKKTESVDFSKVVMYNNKYVIEKARVDIGQYVVSCCAMIYAHPIDKIKQGTFASSICINKNDHMKGYMYRGKHICVHPGTCANGITLCMSRYPQIYRIDTYVFLDFIDHSLTRTSDGVTVILSQYDNAYFTTFIKNIVYDDKSILCKLDNYKIYALIYKDEYIYVDNTIILTKDNVMNMVKRSGYIINDIFSVPTKLIGEYINNTYEYFKFDLTGQYFYDRHICNTIYLYPGNKNCNRSFNTDFEKLQNIKLIEHDSTSEIPPIVTNFEIYNKTTSKHPHNKTHEKQHGGWRRVSYQYQSHSDNIVTYDASNEHVLRDNNKYINIHGGAKPISIDDAILNGYIIFKNEACMKHLLADYVKIIPAILTKLNNIKIPTPEQIESVLMQYIHSVPIVNEQVSEKLNMFATILYIAYYIKLPHVSVYNNRNINTFIKNVIYGKTSMNTFYKKAYIVQHIFNEIYFINIDEHITYTTPNIITFKVSNKLLDIAARIARIHTPDKTVLVDDVIPDGMSVDDTPVDGTPVDDTQVDDTPDAIGDVTTAVSSYDDDAKKKPSDINDTNYAEYIKYINNIDNLDKCDVFTSGIPYIPYTIPPIPVTQQSPKAVDDDINDNTTDIQFVVICFESYSLFYSILNNHDAPKLQFRHYGMVNKNDVYVAHTGHVCVYNNNNNTLMIRDSIHDIVLQHQYIPNNPYKMLSPQTMCTYIQRCKSYIDYRNDKYILTQILEQIIKHTAVKNINNITRGELIEYCKQYCSIYYKQQVILKKLNDIVKVVGSAGNMYLADYCAHFNTLLTEYTQFDNDLSIISGSPQDIRNNNKPPESDEPTASEPTASEPKDDTKVDAPKESESDVINIKRRKEIYEYIVMLCEPDIKFVNFVKSVNALWNPDEGRYSDYNLTLTDHTELPWAMEHLGYIGNARDDILQKQVYNLVMSPKQYDYGIRMRNIDLFDLLSLKLNEDVHVNTYGNSIQNHINASSECTFHTLFCSCGGKECDDEKYVKTYLSDTMALLKKIILYCNNVNELLIYIENNRHDCRQLVILFKHAIPTAMERLLSIPNLLAIIRLSIPRITKRTEQINELLQVFPDPNNVHTIELELIQQNKNNALMVFTDMESKIFKFYTSVRNMISQFRDIIKATYYQQIYDNIDNVIENMYTPEHTPEHKPEHTLPVHNYMDRYDMTAPLELPNTLSEYINSIYTNDFDTHQHIMLDHLFKFNSRHTLYMDEQFLGPLIYLDKSCSLSRSIGYVDNDSTQPDKPGLYVSSGTYHKATLNSDNAETILTTLHSHMKIDSLTSSLIQTTDVLSTGNANDIFINFNNNGHIMSCNDFYNFLSICPEIALIYVYIYINKQIIKNATDENIATINEQYVPVNMGIDKTLLTSAIISAMINKYKLKINNEINKMSLQLITKLINCNDNELNGFNVGVYIDQMIDNIEPIQLDTPPPQGGGNLYINMESNSTEILLKNICEHVPSNHTNIICIMDRNSEVVHQLNNHGANLSMSNGKRSPIDICIMRVIPEDVKTMCALVHCNKHTYDLAISQMTEQINVLLTISSIMSIDSDKHIETVGIKLPNKIGAYINEMCIYLIGTIMYASIDVQVPNINTIVDVHAINKDMLNKYVNNIYDNILHEYYTYNNIPTGQSIASINKTSLENNVFGTIITQCINQFNDNDIIIKPDEYEKLFEYDDIVEYRAQYCLFAQICEYLCNDNNTFSKIHMHMKSITNTRSINEQYIQTLHVIINTIYPIFNGNWEQSGSFLYNIIHNKTPGICNIQNIIKKIIKFMLMHCLFDAITKCIYDHIVSNTPIYSKRGDQLSTATVKLEYIRNNDVHKKINNIIKSIMMDVDGIRNIKTIIFDKIPNKITEYAVRVCDVPTEFNSIQELVEYIITIIFESMTLSDSDLKTQLRDIIDSYIKMFVYLANHLFDVSINFLKQYLVVSNSIEIVAHLMQTM
jgi:hypothetical protein